MNRRITIDAERCVGCGDCSIVCPVLVYTKWQDLNDNDKQRLMKLSSQQRNLKFVNSETEKSRKKEEKLANKVFAYIDVRSCLGKSCRQCADYCWKNAIIIYED